MWARMAARVAKRATRKSMQARRRRARSTAKDGAAQRVRNEQEVTRRTKGGPPRPMGGGGMGAGL